MNERWVIPVSAATAAEVRRHNVPPEERLVVATNYALRPLPESLVNPRVLLSVLPPEQQFDVTAFYSRSKPLSAAALAERAEVDRRASESAEDIGGLRMYYRGSQIPNPDGLPVSPDLGIDYTPDAFSFCIWDSKEQAMNGAGLDEHLAAVTRTDGWYEAFTVFKYDLWTEPGIKRNGILYEDIIFQSKPLRQD